MGSAKIFGANTKLKQSRLAHTGGSKGMAGQYKHRRISRLKTVSGWTYIYVRTGKEQTLVSLNVLNDLSGTTITYLLQPTENNYGTVKQEQLLRLPSQFIQFEKSVRWEQIK